ncbi:unnamed protein product [Schistosoma mattheei]|uniref:JmjC domain-containing protein n=1 Tax=Schistosoma mattheei TaxID=31246 RepID=A0A183NTH8_9TREM|nr:unnamed protein product [Schistosoma mattheei]
MALSGSKEFVDMLLAREFTSFQEPGNICCLYIKSSLAKFVHPPHVVSELSLVTTCWPEDDPNDLKDVEFIGETAPTVQKYCLLSMKGSYTDFHIDFGGSSVWYHVMWLRITFLESTSNVNRPTVYCLHILPGQTIFLPSGWIHAVYTPSDCLVFGGNFLSGLHVSMQLSNILVSCMRWILTSHSEKPFCPVAGFYTVQKLLMTRGE